MPASAGLLSKAGQPHSGCAVPSDRLSCAWTPVQCTVLSVGQGYPSVLRPLKPQDLLPSRGSRLFPVLGGPIQGSLQQTLPPASTSLSSLLFPAPQAPPPPSPVSPYSTPVPPGWYLSAGPRAATRRHLSLLRLSAAGSRAVLSVTLRWEGRSVITLTDEQPVACRE